jgi:hypothetical protein
VAAVARGGSCGGDSIGIITGLGAGASGMHARRYLLAWFAMMAPTLRLELPPAAYLALHEALLPCSFSQTSKSALICKYCSDFEP